MRILHRPTVFAAALLLLPAALQAQEPQKPPPLLVPPSGKLEIRLLVTDEPNKVFRPAKGANGQSDLAQPAKVVPKGKQIVAVVFFQGCQANPAGNCDLDVDLKAVDPQGTAVQDHKAAKLWPNRPAPRAGLVQLGSAYMKLQFEPNDPPGIYRVLAVAHDRVGGTEASSEASFEVK